jgi:hypothetical protein
MSIDEIICECEKLSPSEREEVGRFVEHLSAQRQLAADELGVLAGALAGLEDEERAETLKREMVKGFYGERERQSEECRCGGGRVCEDGV